MEGFYRIEIKEEDKYKAAFRLNDKVYKWNSMVIDFKSFP